MKHLPWFAGLFLFAIYGCLPSDPADDSSDITYQAAIQAGVGTVGDNQEDSIGTGFMLGGALLRADASDRSSGAYFLNFGDHEDSLVMTYYLPGSAEAWASISGALDSLLTLADSASMAEYFRLEYDFQQGYRRVRHYSPQSCAMSAEGSVELDIEGAIHQVPVVFHPLTYMPQLGLRFHIDQGKSGPPSGPSVGDLYGGSFSGTLTVTCPDPLL